MTTQLTNQKIEEKYVLSFKLATTRIAVYRTETMQTLPRLGGVVGVQCETGAKQVKNATFGKLREMRGNTGEPAFSTADTRTVN